MTTLKMTIKTNSLKSKINDCEWCNQTIENCECHIPFEDKHSGLINVIDKSLNNYKTDIKKSSFKQKIKNIFKKK